MSKTFFNQDASCFVVTTTKGFSVYNANTLKSRFARHIGGCPSLVEPLFRTNILALVGGNERFPPNKVQIWNDHENKVIAELEFGQPVTGVKLRRDKICVSTEDRIYIYAFNTLQLLHTFDTAKNSYGLLVINHQEPLMIASLGKEVGSLHIEVHDPKIGVRVHSVSAHHGPLRGIVLSNDGTKIATCSTKGTIVRVFDASNGVLLHELRRGIDQVDITSMAFSSNAKLLAVVSSKGTVHVYDLDAPGASGYLARGERSNAKYYLPPGDYTCAFSSDATRNQFAPEPLIVIGTNNTWYSLNYDGLDITKEIDGSFITD